MKQIKFETIKDIGNLNEIGLTNIEINKNTLIYGENGTGKSTIKSMFNVLALSNKKYLKSKLKFEEKEKIKASFNFSIDSNTQTVDAKNIPNSLKNKVLIYDNEYFQNNLKIEENVIFFGKDADKRRQENELNDSLNLIRNELGVLKESVNFNEDTFDFSIDNDIYAFPKIYSDVITGNINQDDVEIARCIEHIKRLNETTFETFEYDVLYGFIKKNFKVRKLMIEHLNHNIKGSSLKWNIEGVQYINNEFCPFCGSKMGRKSNLLVSEYEKIIDAQSDNEYEMLINIHKYILDKRELFESITEELLFLYNKNFLSKTKYNKLLKIFDLAVMNSIIFKLKSKINNPFVGVKLDVIEKTFFQRLCNFDSYARNSYDLIVKSQTKAEKEVFEGVKKYNEIAAKFVRDELKPILSKINEKCEEYNKTLKQLSSLNKGYVTIGTKKMVNTINYYLIKLAAPFKIKIDENKLLVELKQYLPQQIKTKDTFLSEGEQHLLCLAFFMSFIHSNDEVQFIIFDDPIDMCDICNRVHILNVITTYINNHKDVCSIVMSHDKIFLNTIFKYLERKNINCDFLKLYDDGLKLYDVNKEKNNIISILKKIIKDGEESDKYSDKIAAMMALRLLYESDESVSKELYSQIEADLTYFIHSKYALPKPNTTVLSGKKGTDLQVVLSNYNILHSEVLFDPYKMFKDEFIFLDNDKNNAINLLNEMIFDEDNRVKNALLLRCISESVFIDEAQLQNVKVDKVEQRISNYTNQLLGKKSIDYKEMALAKVGLVNGLLIGYMHATSGNTYSLIDISYREVNKMRDDVTSFLNI